MRIKTIQEMGASSLIVLIIAAIAFSAGGIAVAKILVKGTKNPQKGQAYECGIPTDGSPWNQFNIGYYLFALIFLIFDVELVFLYPWAVVVKKIGMGAFVEIVIFLFILFMGFLYAHKKGALKWM
ncbi:MAG TPA: NADH-quinone oxidoreductase subunit A [Puia sp.]|nr:NADH-quinone oxidoreductase subunit A [Puia sp.]